MHSKLILALTGRRSLMKTTQILYLIIFLGIVLWIVTSTHLLDRVSEGFESLSPEPIIPKTLEPTRLPIQAMPNEANPGPLLYAPYGQTASVGSAPFQDPSLGPASLNQIKKLNEDLRSFLVFEGANVASSSDPTVQLPLTQIRADSRKLGQEVSVLEKNSGIQSTMTQQDLGDIEGALSFLQRKVRLFQTAGVVSSTEGFVSGSGEKTRATIDELKSLQTKIYAAILTLSSTATTDPVVQARIKNLQNMYASITDMISKLNNGTWTADDIPVFKEDIATILPNLANTKSDLGDIFTAGSGKKLSPVEQQLSMLVGEQNAPNVFKGLMDKGMFKVTMDLGYNVPGSSGSPGSKGSKGSDVVYSKKFRLQPDGTMGADDVTSKLGGSPLKTTDADTATMDSAYDTRAPGMDDRAEKKASKPSGLDWKQRTTSICEQVRKRGLDPLDFGCIPEGSLMSPAYSWRGHAKMVCGRLSATVDPDLPRVCGCPPQGWKGWSLSY